MQPRIIFIELRPKPTVVYISRLLYPLVVRKNETNKSVLVCPYTSECMSEPKKPQLQAHTHTGIPQTGQDISLMFAGTASVSRASTGKKSTFSPLQHDKGQRSIMRTMLTAQSHPQPSRTKEPKSHRNGQISTAQAAQSHGASSPARRWRWSSTA